MSTTRSLRNRSSRYSSPATFAENQVSSKVVEAKKNNDGRQASPDKWMEPTVRNAVPSFEDTKGLERVGVLEHMAPLGVPPSQKLLQKLKVNFSRQSLRVTPVNPEDVTPPNEPIRMEVTSSVDTEPLPELNRLEEPIVLSSPPRGRPAKKELDEMRQVVDMTTPSPVKSSFHSVQASPRPQSIQEIIRQDRMRGVFDRAIAEANNQSDLKLVPGLERMFDEAKARPQLWSTLDAVLNRSPTDTQFKVFKRYIKRGIKHYRKNSADLQFSPQAVDHPSSSQSQPVGYLHTFPSHNSSTGLALSSSHSNQSPIRFRPSNHSLMSPTNQLSKSPTKAGASFANTDLQSTPGRKRSQSASSTSSLSSAKSLPEDFTPENVEVDADSLAIEGRPIRLTGQRQATNRVAAGSRTRSSAIPPSEPSHPFSGFPTTIKFVSKKLKTSHRKDGSIYDSETVDARRRDFQHESLDYNNIDNPESSERTILENSSSTEVQTAPSVTSVPPPVIHSNSLPLTIAALLSPPEPQARPELSLTNGTNRKRPYDEIDKDEIDAITPLSSSPVPNFAALTAPVSSTRGATPRAAKLQPPNKARKSARVMVSPNKPKNGGITAGISRAGPGRDTTIGNGADSGGEDNDEFCASCGGEGILLCCDGCPNSFHHGCLEPPLDPDDDVDGEWYCPRCVARRNKESSPATGLMGQIIRRVDHTIPKAYALPFDIRDYFEGVKTGEEGEYEEVGLPRSQNTGIKMNRAGFFEEPSYKELRDSKGNFITCFRCGLTSNGRDIIPCDYCTAKWHTDCVDPPLAVPPRRRGGDKPTGYWRCPLHVEGDLQDFGRQAGAAPGDLGRLPRLRKPKKPFSVGIDLWRGFKNNGIIEVDLMKDEMPDIKERVMDGAIFRIPEKGIRLDFIDRVKKSWYEDHAFPQQLNAQPRIRHRLYRPDDPTLHYPPTPTIFDHESHRARSIPDTAPASVRLQQKSSQEQNAIMSLLGMSDQIAEADLTELANTLVSNASDKASATRETLLKLQELISVRLRVLDSDEQGLPVKASTTKPKPEQKVPLDNRFGVGDDGDIEMSNGVDKSGDSADIQTNGQGGRDDAELDGTSPDH